MRGAVLKMKPRKNPSALPRARASKVFPIVGIGASAGGLEAFSELLRELPEKTGMAFVLVQHLDPKHSSELREILARTTKIPVTEVTDGTAVKPDHVYVIPPDSTMTIKDGVLRLAARTLTRGQHLPIDQFLSSLAEDRGNRAIGVILSGTASDGTEGARAVKAAGGITFAQDEKSAKYSGMPHSAVIAGHVDFVLPPAAIATELARLGQHPYLAPVPPQKPDLGRASADQMETLLTMLRETTSVDFTHYKQSTLQRRIQRRMILHKVETLRDYVRFVRNTPGEIEELYQDILIHVTGFFRDPGAFEALRKHVFPALFHDRRKETVRIWVPGCSTGEEVYSLAMSLVEFLWSDTQKTARTVAGNVPFQIFATDISDTALERARSGLYSEASIARISPERLRRFFVVLDGGYQINKSVREMCIFARQNVAKDPPFSNLDLISCRNLLIYLGPVLQKRVIPTLHYALKPNGYLMLGTAENLGAYGDYFASVDKKYKIFQKKSGSARLLANMGTFDYTMPRLPDSRIPRERQIVSSIEKEADRQLFSRFVPASIVINEEMEILQFRGKTGRYLEPAEGQPTFNLSRMAREGLLVDLRAALMNARKDRATVRKEGVLVHSNGGTRAVNLEVIPIHQKASAEHFYLVIFQEASSALPAKKRSVKEEAGSAKTLLARDNQRLKYEVRQIREQLQTLIEDHETITEEFKAANEEILSANEELQSTNEELETAKEELQSTNEELTTLNEEMQNRNTELTAANNDLLNLLDNVSIPVVIVGGDMHIRRFTPPAQQLLNLLPTDIGRRLTEIRPNLQTEDIGKLAAETIERMVVREVEVQENETGRWYLMRLRPYKTWDNKIDGAVVSFHDIDALKHSLEGTGRYADLLIENAHEAIVILDGHLRVVNANPAFYRTFQVSPKETEARAIYELGNGQWNIPKLRELLEKVLPGNGLVRNFEVRH
ncbi:MAG TPA: chemotaxis protein CheB, partial [Terriglobales bacterium]|nr:chemotaxis protein CheB [Terriglobales bacterium]